MHDLSRVPSHYFVQDKLGRETLREGRHAQEEAILGRDQHREGSAACLILPVSNWVNVTMLHLQ